MLCVCGHEEEDHEEGPCEIWQCGCMTYVDEFDGEDADE